MNLKKENIFDPFSFNELEFLKIFEEEIDFNEYARLFDAGNPAAHIFSPADDAILRGYSKGNYFCTFSYFIELLENGDNSFAFEILIDIVENGWTNGSDYFFSPTFYEGNLNIEKVRELYEYLKNKQERPGACILLALISSHFFRKHKVALSYLENAEELLNDLKSISYLQNQISFLKSFISSHRTPQWPSDDIEYAAISCQPEPYYGLYRSCFFDNYFKKFIKENNGLKFITELYHNEEKKEERFRELFFKHNNFIAGYFLAYAYKSGSYWTSKSKEKYSEIIDALYSKNSCFAVLEKAFNEYRERNIKTSLEHLYEAMDMEKKYLGFYSIENYFRNSYRPFELYIDKITQDTSEEHKEKNCYLLKEAFV